MNCNLESGRVLAAVDDTYDELLFLSRLAGGSGGDVTEIASDELDAHLDAYRDGDTHALHETTSALCRWLRRDPEAFERITRKRDGDEDEEEANPEMAELVRSFDDARRRLTARLTRTAEHAARARDAYDQVLYREKTANEQKVALQNQLALETVEREKRVKTANESEAKVRRELATLESNAAADVDAFAADARETDAAEHAVFTSNVAELKSAVAKASEGLAKLREKHAAGEAALRKKVSDTEKKLAAKLGDYDDEVLTIQNELKRESAAHEKSSRAVADYVKDADAMRAEREREEALKKRLEAASERRREKILDKAAAVIQLAWAKHRESAPAAPKAEPERKGGKKGKKGKKGK